MKALRITFTVLFSVLLFVTLLTTGLVFSVRQSYTDERVYHRFDTLVWGDILLPIDGEEKTVRTLFNEQVGAFLGEEADAEGFENLVSYFSIDAIVVSLVQDFRAWLFDYGPVPRLDPVSTTEMVMSGMSDQVLWYISLLGDPKEVVLELVENILEDVDIPAMLSPYEDYRFFLSDTLLYLAATASGVLVLLILILNGLHLSAPLLFAGSGLLFTGMLILFGKPVLDTFLQLVMATEGIPWDTFNLIYALLSFSPVGIFAVTVGLALMILSIVILAVT